MLGVNTGVSFSVEEKEKAGMNGAMASKGASEGDSEIEGDTLDFSGEGEALWWDGSEGLGLGL